MSFFPPSLENLIDKFAALPGIGKKSAQRLAFHVLSLPEQEAVSFAKAILEAKAESIVHIIHVPFGLHSPAGRGSVYASPAKKQT